MNYGPTEKQWEGLKKLAERMKALGWKYGREVKVQNGDILRVTMIDPHGKKHWILVNKKGELVPAPVTMVSNKNCIL